MNAAKLSPSLTPKSQTHSHLAIPQGPKRDGLQMSSKNITSPAPHVSQLTEWIDLSSSESSMTDMHEELLDEGVLGVVLTKDAGLYSEDEDDIHDSTTKREDKYLKRRLKNERNYKDLNKSLANLALKRETRSSSTDNNTLLYNSQNQTQTDKSYNFEFQPPFCSPGSAPKNFSVTTNHTNLPNNISSGFQSKNYSGFSQYSPQKATSPSQYSPKRQKPTYHIEISRCESDYPKIKNITPKSDHYLTPMRSKSPADRKDVSERMEVARVQEYRGLQDPWLNTKLKFFPGNLEKLEKLSARQNEESRSNITPRKECVVESRFSFNDLNETRKPVLDSKLPSKIDFSEKLSTRETDDAGTIHEKMSIFEDDGLQGRLRDDSILGGGSFSQGGVFMKSKEQEEGKFEQVEKRTLDMWKKDLLQIKNEMEMRQKNYQEVSDFVKMCEDREKYGRHANEGHSSSRSKASIFSSPAHFKAEGSGSKTSRAVLSTPSENNRSAAHMQSTPQSRTLLSSDRSRSPISIVKMQSSESRDKGNKNQSYFRFNNENNNGPSIASYYKEKSQEH